MNCVARILAVALFLITSSLAVPAQSVTVDPTFAPVPSRSFTPDDIAGKGIVVQPDGKSVIWKGNFAIGGKARSQIARLNSDGSLDESFSYCGCGLDEITNVGVQPDGKLLVAGIYFAQAKMIRLNGDGSLDNSFNSVFSGEPALLSSAEFIAVQPDGKILVNVLKYFAGGFHGRNIGRLLADGSTDPGFTNVVYDGGRLITTVLRSLALDPASGKIYMAFTTYSGSSQTSALFRYNPDGTADNTWERPTFGPATSYFAGLVVQPDGSLLIAGQFDTVNGLSKTNIVRLAPAGNVDANFTGPSLGPVGQLAVLTSGKILVTTAAPNPSSLLRLNVDGSIDNTFTFSPTVSSITSAWALDSSERIYFLGLSTQGIYRYFRLNPNGDADAGFNPAVGLFGKIQTLARQADGRIIMAGSFNQLNGVTRQGIARVSSDGTLDNTFDAGTGFSSTPRALVVQGDGKIIAVGSFSTIGGSIRQAIARLNTDGTLDNGFLPVIPSDQSVLMASLQTNGQILIAGNFSSVNGMTRTGVARLNVDGTLDNSFNPVFGSPSINDIFQQPDGKIIVAGNFAGVNGFNRSGAVRLNNDGSLDQSFNALGIGLPTRIWLQPDGKYFHINTTFVGRRNSDGSADGAFVSPAFDTIGSNGRSIDDAIVLPDGTYILVGRFDYVGNTLRPNICRLSSSGSLDILFAPTGTNAPVRSILRQPDGKIVIGGEFSKLENVVRAGAARLSVSAYRVATPFDFDGDGRADVAVYRPSSGVWYQLFSSGNPYGSPTFGLAGDIPTPADYDGDGRTDLAIFRPSTGTWWYNASATGQLRAATLGQAGDIPLPSDYTGDGQDDFVTFRPSNSTWYRTSNTGGSQFIQFGLPGDIPVIGDFDGDGKSDPAIFRPSNGDWWYMSSAQFNQHRTLHWGAMGDVPAPADYDGDGKSDFAVFRPSNGAWYIFKSSDLSWIIQGFGLSGDRPTPADYDGDGRADIAVFRPSTGVWYILQSTAGITGAQWGLSTDVAIPNAFTPQQ